MLAMCKSHDMDGFFGLGQIYGSFCARQCWKLHCKILGKVRLPNSPNYMQPEHETKMAFSGLKANLVGYFLAQPNCIRCSKICKSSVVACFRQVLHLYGIIPYHTDTICTPDTSASHVLSRASKEERRRRREGEGRKDPQVKKRWIEGQRLWIGGYMLWRRLVAHRGGIPHGQHPIGDPRMG